MGRGLDGGASGAGLRASADTPRPQVAGKGVAAGVGARGGSAPGAGVGHVCSQNQREDVQ